MLSKYIKIIACLAIPVTPLIIRYFLIKKYNQLLKSCKPIQNSNYEFIFTTFNNLECKQHIYTRVACSDKCSYNYLATIVKFMENAKHSISLCMCIVTLTEIQDALIRAHHRGLTVRFLADSEMIGNKAARAKHLRNSGICIKVQPYGGDILHHKFCLIDEHRPVDAKLLTGSLNLTCQGLTSNWDVTMFTDNPKIVKRFRDEFEHMWCNFQELR